jgi:ligand-binding sensor domain-containing protein
MKPNRAVLLISLSLLIITAVVIPHAATASPKLETSSPLAIAAAGDVWNLYTNANDVTDLAVDGGKLWAASSGGLVQWDLSSGAYIKYHPTNSDLAYMNVNTVFINTDGKKWFGTSTYTNTFDGAIWATLYEPYCVTDIARDSSGNLWFATCGYGIKKYDGAIWTTYDKSNSGLSSNVVNTIAAEGNIIWAGTYGSGIFKFDGTTWTNYKIGDLGTIENMIHDIAIAPNGTKWFAAGNSMGWSGGGGGSLTSFDGVNWVSYTEATSGLISDYVFAVAVDADNIVWAGTEDGVSKFNGATWTNYTSANGLANNWVTSIFLSGDEVWFGTLNGISRLDNTTWTTFKTTDRLPDNNLYTLGVQKKDVWFSGGDQFVINTLNRAVKYNGLTWTDYFNGDGLNTPEVHAIAADAAGKLWFGGWGIFSFDGVNWQEYEDPYNSGITSAIAIDGNVKWFYTQRPFTSIVWVSRYDGVNWNAYTVADGLIGTIVNAIAVDPNHIAWFGTSVGVSSFDGTTWTSYTTAQGLVHNKVYAVVVDQAGNKWFGTDGGLSKFNGTTWTNYTTENGLPDNNIRALAFDLLGNLWIATYGGGVVKYDGSQWITYNTGNSGLAGNNVMDLVINSENHKWFYTSTGVSEFYTLPPTLDINYKTGAPGSSFNITGLYFPPSQTVVIDVNQTYLGSAEADSDGTFVVTLTTSETADLGYYLVTAGVPTLRTDESWLSRETSASSVSAGELSASQSFILDDAQPVRPVVGTYPELEVPDGIGWRLIFTPLIVR